MYAEASIMIYLCRGHSLFLVPDNYSFADWGSKIDVVGFCFLDLASNYEPPESLVKWLKAGTKPIYIGFGSLVSFLLTSLQITCFGPATKMILIFKWMPNFLSGI